MNRLRRSVVVITVALACAAAAGRSAANTPEGSRLDSLETQLKELRLLYEARIAALEKQVADLEAGRAAAAAPAPSAGIAPAAPGATPPPSEPDPMAAAPVPSAPLPPAPAPAQASNYFNPAIAVIGNFLAVGGHNRVENRPSASLRESEIGLQAVVDPYARADFFVGFGEEGAEMEEGYITFLTLPGDFQAKVGRMRAGFGKINPLHLHVLPWPDEPLPVVNFLGGEEGWIGDGVSVARIIPLPGDTFSEATVQIFSGDAEGLFEAPERSDLAYNARYRVFRDLSESVNIDVGASWATGPNGTTERGDTSLLGVDATLRWKPLRTARHRSAIFRGEYIYSHREQPIGDARSDGWLVSGEYQLARRWFVGARLEAANRADNDLLTDKGAAALLTFWPSEFSQLRGELRRRRYADDTTADEILLQIQFAIGAHGAHPF